MLRRTGFARQPYQRQPRMFGRIARLCFAGASAMREPVEKERPLECEAYRRLVAANPCAHCGIEGFSNCAHPNNDKAKGAKADDRFTFPLCVDRPGIVGCHFRFDQHQLFTREAEASYARIWGRMTRLEIIAAGAWPASLPRLPNE